MKIHVQNLGEREPVQAGKTHATEESQEPSDQAALSSPPICRLQNQFAALLNRTGHGGQGSFPRRWLLFKGQMRAI